MVLQRPEEYHVARGGRPGQSGPQASAQHLANIRSYLRELAAEAGLADPDSFARQWHILMKGSIIAAAEGDTHAAARARKLGILLLDHHGIPTP